MRNRVLIAALVAALGSLSTVPAEAGARRGGSDNAIFVNANDPAGNAVVVLRRTREGQLLRVASFSTGGRGSGVGEIHPPDPLGSQGALLLSDDGDWLFAANPGSNEITTFRVLKGGLLRRTSVVSSGGAYPNSITALGNLVYVLNAGGNTNVTGFRLSPLGVLVPIAGSTRELDNDTDQLDKQPNITNGPSQARLSPDGKFLVVTDKNSDNPPGTIQIFKVQRDGRLSAAPTVTRSIDPAPFGVDFDDRGHLFVLDDVIAAVQSFDINPDGTLQNLSAAIIPGQVTPASIEPCWIDMSGNFAFTSNTSSNDISSFRVGRRGELTLVDPHAGQVGSGSAPIDIAISGNERWLHVLSGAKGIVRVFRINQASGKLTLTDEIKLFDPLTGAAGIAAQ